jgi:hypothetical protein
MNTITTTKTIAFSRYGFFAMLAALTFGVVFAFASGIATPSTASAADFGAGDCGDCGWEDDYYYNSYDYYGYSDDYSDDWVDDYYYNSYDYYDYHDYSYDYSYDDYDYDYSYDYYDYDYSYDDYDYSYDYWYDYDYEYDYHYDYHYDYCSNIPGDQPSGYDCHRDNDREPVCALSAEDTSIEEGDSTELHWTSENATSATLSSFGSVSTGGSRSVSPTSDKTYTLTVRDNDGDTDTCSVHINVEEDEDEDEDEDLSCDLTVSDSRVEEGDEVTLEWDIDGDANYASINQGIGRVDEDGGEEDVDVDEDTTFRLTVRDSHGNEDTCSATVRVDEENDFSSIDFSGGPVNNPSVVYLSQLPYTGVEDITPSMWGFLVTLFGLVGMGAYYVFVKRRQVA